MLTIRRLYLYAMSGVMLVVLASGLRLLLSVLLDTLGLAGDPALGGGSTRETLSLAGALVGVGLPVWAIHWWLVRRATLGGDAEAEAERASPIRAAYVSIVLAVTLAFMATAAIDVVRSILQEVLDLRPAYGSIGDPAGSIATILICGAAWGFHAWVRRVDLLAGPLSGGAVLWPRLYLYVAQLITLVAMTGAVSGFTNALADRIAAGGVAGFDDYANYTIPSALAVLAVAGALFLAHAVYTLRLVAEPGWRGESERRSHMRVGYLVILIGAGLSATIGGLGESLRGLLLVLLGAADGSLPPGGIARATIVPLVVLAPWLGAAVHARYQLLREAGRAPAPGRAAAGTRLDQHVRSLVGLGYGAVALAWLLGIALDALIGGDRYALGSGGRAFDLASFLPNAILGLAVWALAWARVTASRVANPDAEASSGIRRAALLAVLGAGLAASVGSAAFILYRVFGSALGVVGGPGVASELASAMGILVVAAAVALYHGLVVREDVRARAHPTDTTAAGIPVDLPSRAVPATPPPAGGERPLVLHADPGVDLDAALAAARAALPPGAHLVDARQPPTQ